MTEEYKVWADSVSLATTPEIVIYFLFLALLRCFSSGGSLSITLYIQVTMQQTWLCAGFPIRTFPDQSLLTAPRDLSQSSTSFIGNIRLGIRCVPLSTFLCIVPVVDPFDNLRWFTAKAVSQKSHYWVVLTSNRFAPITVPSIHFLTYFEKKLNC